MLIIYILMTVIDKIIYTIAGAIFRVIMTLKGIKIFENDTISPITTRIYMILGVLIVFEVIISAVQYLVDPDKFEDKEKGFFGLLQKTVITIALIVIVPVIFDFAIQIEDVVVESIPSIIFGEKANNATEGDVGDRLAFTVLSSFVHPNKNKGGSVGEGGEIHDIESFSTYVLRDCSFWDASGCKYNYFILVSSLCGGFLCYVLISMALDIAIRSIKLSIIQILSPIPISTYVFGKDKFNKFVKMSLQVYADLFIRMAIIYFIIFAFDHFANDFVLKRILATSSSNVGEWLQETIVNLMIIFGLLMFAKNAPKFLSDLLGLPEITGGDMADMFKPAWQRVGGFASPAAAIGAYRNAREYGEKRRLAWRRALSAGAHATVARLRDVASGKSLDESYKSARDAAMARTNRNLEYRNRYKGFHQRHQQIWQERFDNYTGVTTGAKRTSAEITAAHTAMDIKSKAWARANAKSLESTGKWGAYIDPKGVLTGAITLTEALDLQEKFAASPTTQNFTLANGTVVDRLWLKENIQSIKDHASRAYIMEAFTHATTTGDGETINTVRNKVLEILRSGADAETLNRIFTQSVKDRNDDGSEIHDASGNPVMVTYNLKALYDKVQSGKNLTKKEAWAMADMIQGINRNAGNVESEALQRKTSDPNAKS